MDIKGVWRVKFVKMLLGDDAGVMKDLDEALASGDDENFAEIAAMRFIFDETEYRMGSLIPEGVSDEEIKEAVASGEVEIYDNKYVVSPASAYKADGDGFVREIQDEVEGLSPVEMEALKRINIVDGMPEINAIFGFYYLVRE